MPLINTSIRPHSPLLIPEISHANYKFLSKTILSYERLEAELESKHLDTLIIISPHGPLQDKSFTLNISPELEINFKDFGFIPPRTIFKGDTLLADSFKNQLRPDFPIQLASEKQLDYGSAIPAYLLKNLLKSKKIIIISPASALNLEEHLRFGQKLQTIIAASPKQIAVLSSSDLSHRLKRKSPGGYSPKGAKFDNKLIEYLNEPKSAAENILKIDEHLQRASGECGLKPIVILLGILAAQVWEPENLVYQTDFGVGYLSLDCKI